MSWSSALSAASSAPISAIDLDPQGNILLGGQFFRINGDSRENIARVFASGSLDPGFFVSLSVGQYVNQVIQLADGGIAASVNFGTGGSDVGHRLLRFTSTGARDGALAAYGGLHAVVGEIAVYPNRKIAIAGSFGSINTLDRPNFARFNANGSADTLFRLPPPLTGNVSALPLQPDSKLLIGGNFRQRSTDPASKRRWFSRSYLQQAEYSRQRPQHLGGRDPSRSKDHRVWTNSSGPIGRRLNVNGAIDSSFIKVFVSGVERAIVQPDGKVIIAGTFTTVNGDPRGRIAR